jgi:nucleoside transporter
MKSAVPASAPPLVMSMRVILSIMMFLQFSIWGSWVIVYYPFLVDKGFSPAQATSITANIYLGAMLSSLFAGYVADRFINSERLMAICHFLGAGLLYAMSRITSPDQYAVLFVVSFLYSMVFNPTLAVVNSIAFRNIPDGSRDFPGLRVLGTIGWIMAGLTIDAVFSGTMISATSGKEVAKTIGTNGPLLQAAILSFLFGCFCLVALPKTPPLGKGAGALDFLRAIGMLKDFSYAVFFVVTLFASIAMGMYFNSAGDFLDKAAGVSKVGSTLAIGQGVELFLLVLLPFFLSRFGLKTVMCVGLFCWAFRYLLFANGGPSGVPFAMIILGVAVHGFCFDFFFASGFIHADKSAPPDLKASAQSLLGFLVYGLGTWLGTLFCGYLNTRYQDAEKVTDWHAFWMVPSVVLFGVLIAFVALFWPKKDRSTSVA